jgi:hypothetical protein
VLAIVEIFRKHADLVVQVALGGALTGVFWFLYQGRHRPVREPELTRDLLANLLESCHAPDFKTRLPATAVDTLPSDAQSKTIRIFLKEIGLLKENGTPISELADAFLCSLTASLRETRTNFICNWSAHQGSHEYNAARAMLRQIEETRITGRALTDVRAARRVQSGLALIRADIAGEPHFLMIESHRWNGPAGWWFVGGTEEPKDAGDLGATVRREVNEELGVMPNEPDAVLDCSPLFPAASIDKRISGGYGILTEYHFHMFAARLKPEHLKVQVLLRKDPLAVEIPMREAVRIHRFRWITWAELLLEPHLNMHTPYLLDDLRRRIADPKQIPATATIT